MLCEPLLQKQNDAKAAKATGKLVKPGITRRRITVDIRLLNHEELYRRRGDYFTCLVATCFRARMKANVRRKVGRKIAEGLAKKGVQSDLEFSGDDDDGVVPEIRVILRHLNVVKQLAIKSFVKQNIEAALKKNEVEFEIKVHRVLYSSCMDGQWIESAKLKALAAQEHPPPPPDDSSYQNATHSHTKSHRHSSRTNSDALAVADDDDDSSSCYAFASSGRGSYRSSSWRAGSSSATNGNGTGSGKLQHWRRSHAKKHGNKKNRRLSSIVVDR